jgi:hypothetical protein
MAATFFRASGSRCREEQDMEEELRRLEEAHLEPRSWQSATFGLDFAE